MAIINPSSFEIISCELIFTVTIKRVLMFNYYRKYMVLVRHVLVKINPSFDRGKVDRYAMFLI